MKNTFRWWILTVGALATVAWSPTTARADGPVTRRGTSVMHYMVRHSLTPTNDPSQVLGTLRLQHNEQGRSSKQSLDIRLTGLAPSTVHDLTAVLGDDPNAVVVGTFNSDTDGRARLSFKSKGQGRGGKNNLPEILSPLTNVRAIGVNDTNSASVASARIDTAPSYQYLVKRNLTAEDSNGTAAGSISLVANPNKVNLRLLAGGLSPTNDYHLVLNSNIVFTTVSSEVGRLEIKVWPDGAPPVLELRELAIWDASNHVVLKTSLPR